MHSSFTVGITVETPGTEMMTKRSGRKLAQISTSNWSSAVEMLPRQQFNTWLRIRKVQLSWELSGSQQNFCVIKNSR